MDRLYNRGKTLLSSLKPQLPVKRDEVEGRENGESVPKKANGREKAESSAER